MTPADLSEILAAHARWLRGDIGGARANLARANLIEADLSGADLSGASLFGAFLFGANLNGAILTGANLSRANLTDADLARTDLTGADLTGANLTGAQGVRSWSAGQVGTGCPMLGVVVDGVLRIWAGCWSGTAEQCRANLTQPGGPAEYELCEDRDALIADVLAGLDRIEAHCLKSATPMESER